MKKKIFALCAVALTLSGCGKIPKLSNGDEAIVTFKDGHMISANELYNSMKDDYALAALIGLIDNYIFETEFADYKDDALAYAENSVEGLKQQYGEQQALQVLYNYYGYSSFEAYQNATYVSRMRNHAIEEYAKKQITDEQVEKYYNDVLKGDAEISHILITPETKDDMTDDEKKEAENKAKDTAKEIIEKLKKAEDVEATFKDLAKEYSDDEATKNDGGSLGRITYGDLDDAYDELLNDAYKLKDGGFSNDVITTELGYHVILKTKTYEKEALDKVKDEIIDDLSQDYLEEHQSDIGIVALQEYRKNYEMEIQDDKVKKQFTTYIENSLSLARQQEAETEAE